MEIEVTKLKLLQKLTNLSRNKIQRDKCQFICICYICHITSMNICHSLNKTIYYNIS